mmetsp:Transcript_114986/g.198706  ORF Transcript_114986/g.198706 Transcript_114986/m.198706 type:complete len:546 (+) Transcript_114986:67-1704(+)
MEEPESPPQTDRRAWQLGAAAARAPFDLTWNPEELVNLEQQLAELGSRLYTLEQPLESAEFIPADDGWQRPPASANSSRTHGSAPAEPQSQGAEENTRPEREKLPEPDVEPSTRQERAVKALADQLQHESAGVRKSAARSLGRLAEAALRRGLSEVTLEHAGVLADMHLDSSADVREVAFSALAEVRQAADEHPSGAAITSMLSEQLRGHAATRFYRGPSREPAHAELPMTPAKRSISGGGRSSSTHRLRQALSETSLHPSRVAAQRLLRPRHMSKQAVQRARALDKEEAKQDTRELLRHIHKSLSPAEEKQEAQRLAQQLGDPDAAVRASAAMALGNLGQAAQQYVGLLMDRLTDRDSFVRAAAAVAIGKLRKPPLTGQAPTRPISRSPSRKRRVKNSRSASSGPRSTSLSGGALGPNSLARAGSIRPVGRRSRSQAGGSSRPSSAPRTRQAASRKLAWSGNSSLNQLSFDSSMQNSKSGLSRRSSKPTLLAPSSVDNIVIRCCCGLPAARQQARNGGPNEGRFFYCCPQEKGQQCAIFVWEPD